MTMTLLPSLAFDDQVNEAAACYASALPGLSTARSFAFPTVTSTAFPPELSGQTISTDIVWCGSTINLLNTGAGFEERTGFALMASFCPAYLEDPRAALEHTYATLAQDGGVLAPLGEYPWCSY